MKPMRFVFFLSVLLSAASLAGAQTIYIKVRPAVPVVVRPAAPGPTHIWIAEEWRPAGGRYVYAGGYWATPPKPGWIWIPGHWKRHVSGEYWVPGHWTHRH